MKRWRMVSGVLLVFILGVLVGSLGTGFYHQYLSDRFKKDPAERKAFILKKFSERLHLAKDQETMFKTIIDQMDQERREQIQNSRSDFRKTTDEGYAKMKKALSPDQQISFDELIKEIRNRRKIKWKN